MTISPLPVVEPTADLRPLWLDTPTVDEYGTVTIGSWGGWLIQIMPMIFNDRLVLSPETAPDVYDFGWCFPKGGAAHIAALVWDPVTQAESVGYIKAVHIMGPRVAGQVAEAFADSGSAAPLPIGALS